MAQEFTVKDGVLTAYSGTNPRVRVPGGVKAVGYNAFYRNLSVEEVELPESVETVSDWAFAGCERLERICLPNGLLFLGNGAFLGCGALEGINLPEGLKTIGTGCFKFCKGLERIRFPQTLERIGDGAFGGCKNLLCLYFPIGVKFVGKEICFDGGYKVFFCEADERPEGWDPDWNVAYDDGYERPRFPTLWGYTEQNGEIAYRPKKQSKE